MSISTFTLYRSGWHIDNVLTNGPKGHGFKPGPHRQILKTARRAGCDGSMSTSGSAGPVFDPRRGSKFSNLRARSGGDVYFLIAKLYITGLD